MRKSARRRPYVAKSRTLATCPWKMTAVFAPIEQIISGIRSSGTVDAAKGAPVFQEHMKGGWYEMVPALAGVIHFHEIALSRHQLPVELDGLRRLSAKLDKDAPLFDTDLDAAEASIVSCKRQATALTVDEAQDILDTIRMSIAMDKISTTTPPKTA